MGSVADRLDSMVVKVLSPDKNIQTVITDRSTVEVKLRPGILRGYSIPELQYQLERLAWLTWSGFGKGYDAAVGRSPEARRQAGQNLNPTMSRFHDDVRKLKVRAKSPGDVVWVNTTGMQSWEIDLHERNLAKLNEEQFAAEITTTANELVTEFIGQVALLKHKHFRYSFVKER